MRIDEKKVISKIAALASSISNGENGDTNEARLKRAISNCAQIVAICELLEFEQPAPQLTPAQFGIRDVMEEQTVAVRPIIPEGPDVITTGYSESILSRVAEDVFGKARREQK